MHACTFVIENFAITIHLPPLSVDVPTQKIYKEVENNKSNYFLIDIEPPNRLSQMALTLNSYLGSR